MTNELNDTHDPTRRSWVESANDPSCDFPIQNLPFGIFSTADRSPRGGVAIGDQILDLEEAVAAELFDGIAERAARFASKSTLNLLLGFGNKHASALRAEVSELLCATGKRRNRAERIADRLLVPIACARLHLPADIGSFTDFLCSLDHTRRMSPTGTLPPAFRYLPIAYNSRASSVRLSGDAFRRPNGQFKRDDGYVTFGPEPAQDFELELGAFIGSGNDLGTPISIEDAPHHVFGYCLLNDWSARRIQSWESQPLGPFLSKSLSTTISPWIVTTEAMAPFQIASRIHQASDPPLPPYLSSTLDRDTGSLDLTLEAYILTPRMRQDGVPAVRITKTNFKHLYWTFAQMVTHHTSNGCNLRPGDLLGSGTISGPSDESRACLAELTRRGTEPLSLPNGEQRAWLEDGDEVIFRARAARPGYAAIGFGECRGEVAPAVSWPSGKARN